MKKGTASGRAIAVIPARFASTRFPGKPLTPLLGKPMVQHVYQRCVESGVFARVLVATDDERIAKAVKNFGGRAVMTSPNCHSGTDRVHQALAELELDAKSVVVNVQGDEPALHPAALAALVDAFKESTVKMATLVRALHSEERSNPNVVKAVLDEQSNALYFSRADLPYLRASESALLGWAHVGIYGYRWATASPFAAASRVTRQPRSICQATWQQPKRRYGP